MTAAGLTARPYVATDEDAAIALWLRAWQAAYPEIDFAARLAWWRQRWRDELVPAADIVVAEGDRGLVGFVTVDAQTLYLDQLVVAPDCWRAGIGALLIGAAKRISPRGLDLHVNTDNARAIAFYQRQGFAIDGAERNPISGRPVHRMRWRP